jgi:hypothetical protein
MLHVAVEWFTNYLVIIVKVSKGRQHETGKEREKNIKALVYRIWKGDFKYQRPLAALPSLGQRNFAGICYKMEKAIGVC